MRLVKSPDYIRYILKILIDLDKDNVNALLKWRLVCRWTHSYIKNNHILDNALINSGYGQKYRCSGCFTRYLWCTCKTSTKQEIFNIFENSSSLIHCVTDDHTVHLA